jgi:hypothetical protein
MRELIYGVEGKAANLKTFAIDEPGHGGACHHYHVITQQGEAWTVGLVLADIEFQNGPINEKGIGIKGVQNEDLLAIVMDRLQGFQKGPYQCEDNALALDAIKEAMGHLERRTKQRIDRGVEGTHTV